MRDDPVSVCHSICPHNQLIHIPQPMMRWWVMHEARPCHCRPLSLFAAGMCEFQSQMFPFGNGVEGKGGKGRKKEGLHQSMPCHAGKHT